MIGQLHCNNSAAGTTEVKYVVNLKIRKIRKSVNLLSDEIGALTGAGTTVRLTLLPSEKDVV